MITRLGIIAGEILIVLEEINRPITLDEVEHLISYPIELTLMAFGWLVREGHIHVQNRDNKLYICCSPKDKIHCPAG